MRASGRRPAHAHGRGGSDEQDHFIYEYLSLEQEENARHVSDGDQKTIFMFRIRWEVWQSKEGLKQKYPKNYVYYPHDGKTKTAQARVQGTWEPPKGFFIREGSDIGIAPSYEIVVQIGTQDQEFVLPLNKGSIQKSQNSILFTDSFYDTRVKIVTDVRAKWNAIQQTLHNCYTTLVNMNREILGNLNATVNELDNMNREILLNRRTQASGTYLKDIKRIFEQSCMEKKPNNTYVRPFTITDNVFYKATPFKSFLPTEVYHDIKNWKNGEYSETQDIEKAQSV